MRVRSIAALIAVAAVSAACGTEELGPDGYEPNQPAGRIRFVHAISDARASAINVTVDGVPLGVNLVYAGTAPTTALPNPGVAPAPATLYYPAYAGNRQFAVRRTADTTVRLLDAAVPIAQNVDHTVIAVGSGTAITSLVLTDNNTAPAAGNVKLRAVNAATAAGNVDVYITASTTDILTIPPTIAGLAPRTASAYVERPAGAFRVRFTTAGTKTVVRDVSIAALSAGAIRTVVLLEAAAGGTPLTSATLTDR